MRKEGREGGGGGEDESAVGKEDDLPGRREILQSFAEGEGVRKGRRRSEGIIPGLFFETRNIILETFKARKRPDRSEREIYRSSSLRNSLCWHFPSLRDPLSLSNA